MDKVNNLNENKKEVKNTKKEAPARPFMTPPAGKPLPKHMVQAPNGKMIPQGKPLKKSEVAQEKLKEEAVQAAPVEVKETAPVKEAAPEVKVETKVEVKAEVKPEPKKEPEKPATDYVSSGPTLKIVKRAVDIEREEKEAKEKAAAEKAARAAERAERGEGRGDRPARGERGDRPARGEGRGDRPERGERRGDR
ncbi:MAG: hypothetical protein IIX88_00685, partial [Firmicutes bacterium]|nr:hypothetical protein [Bacillota bacterium]